MELYDTLLFLHVLSAFVAVAALAVLWGVAAATREPAVMAAPTAASVARWSGIVVGTALLAALLLGIWLAVDAEAYELSDGWILASLVLWLIGAVAGGRGGKEFERGPEGRRNWLRLQAGNSLILLAILALMIWKPGA